ncbi:hypothetical protein WKY82_09485 [Gordonia malaquae]|uniref:hypothetical protein n=1 Tax=Gordonia malaquae TaxID=410332 RepID=UPI003016E4C2
MIDRSEVHFADTVMMFAHYPFRAASVISDPTLHTSQIRDVDPTSCPPEIRTVDGETLFVAKADEPLLAEFAERNGIPVVHRPDVWPRLLEPFLDTEWTGDSQRSARELLLDVGIEPGEARAVRLRVWRIMRAFNAIMWDEWNLSLYDLLLASTWFPTRIRRKHRPEFYNWAMELADRPTSR